ncbi:MAG TPA: class III extradiol ring-cleavage dioxygenase, partial [Rhodocyclaceae bacterium]|nr:class III extradiol ring-cleavage dioxygenase [Rhodocyclaceae bacterium]
MSHPTPPTIHDFGGFPEALYALRYSAPGDPEVAQQVIDLLAAAGLPARANPARGLDHGAWVPLMHMYPDANLPVLQLSLPRTASTEVLWQIGEALQALTENGILLIASGGITHNLYEFRMGVVAEEAYAREFMEWFASRVASGDKAALLDYRRQAPDA